MDNKLKNLCQCVIEGELTTKILKEKCGIQGRYLNDLLEKKILVRIERGKYRLNDLAILKDYAIDLVKSGERDNNTICNVFLKMVELNPNYNLAYFQLMMNKIHSKNFAEAYKYLNMLRKNTMEGSDYWYDYNLYLYLLSFVTKVNENDFDIVKNISLKLVLPDDNDNRFKDKNWEFEFRKSIINNNFGTSLKKLTEKKDEKQLFYTITNMLLSGVFRKIKKDEKIINNLIEAKEYDMALKYIKEIRNNNLLNNREYNGLKLLEKYNDMLLTKEVPIYTEINCNNRYDAAYKNDFSKALMLSNSKDYYDLLLHDIVALRDKIINGEDILEDNKVNFNPLNEAFTLLQNNEITSSLGYIKKYLKSIKREEYYEIVISLIQVDISKKDKTFKETFNLLNQIQDPKFTYVIDPYVNGFFTEGRNGNIMGAKMYLNIIKNSQIFTRAYEISAGLEDTLEYYKSKTNEDYSSKIENDTNSKIEFNSFGIPYYKEIIELIMDKVSFKEIKERFNLNDKEELYLYLIATELYYNMCLYSLGDYYIVYLNTKVIDDKKLLEGMKEVLNNREHYQDLNLNIMYRRESKKC